MIAAIDIETIPNVDMIQHLPEPKVDSRLKDPAKIEAAKEKGKQDQIDKMALDAMTARICCVAIVGDGTENAYCIDAASDESERLIVQEAMDFLSTDDTRIATWNGINFDLPMIYKRAMILGVDPANFNAPPLTAWTKRYSADRHYDLMQIWGGWSTANWASLEVVAKMVLGEERDDIDYKLLPELIKTEEGRALIREGCVNHTQLTWDLFNKFLGFMFV